MTTLLARVPDYLALQAREIASREQISVDEVVAIALAAHFPAWSADPAKAPPLPPPPEDAKGTTTYVERMDAIHKKHPRAYERWEHEEDDSLRRFHASGLPVNEIAHRLQRQPSAIESRLGKLGLITRHL